MIWAANLCAPCQLRQTLDLARSLLDAVHWLPGGFLPSGSSHRLELSDRLSLRAFLGIALHEPTPDHSSLTIWRQRLSLDVYRAAFQRILAIVHRQGLISVTPPVSRTPPPSKPMPLSKRLARKDSGASYLDYVKELRGAGEEPADIAAVIRFDRKRKGKNCPTSTGNQPPIPTLASPR